MSLFFLIIIHSFLFFTLIPFFKLDYQKINLSVYKNRLFFIVASEAISKIDEINLNNILFGFISRTYNKYRQTPREWWFAFCISFFRKLVHN
ncbi:hypothetical protein SD78_3440 [Bacillus badius]|nr:hypothetical protein SD78_3440 [Bacillus badius]